MATHAGPAQKLPTPVSEGRLARLGLTLAGFAEKWFPEPLVFAFLAVVVVYFIGIAAGENPVDLGLQAGKSFWVLAPEDAPRSRGADCVPGHHHFADLLGLEPDLLRVSGP